MFETLSARSRWTVTAIVAVAVAAMAAGVATDLRSPTAAQWTVTGVLAAVALAGHLVGLYFHAADSESSPPWDVHTVWLLPAALLTPPVAFLPLVALSVSFSLARRRHRLAVRLVVCGITVLTTATIHALTLVIDPPLLAGIAGIAVHYLIGVVIALAASHLFRSPTGAAVWLDYRWSLVQLGCAFSGLLVALAMVTQPWAGLAALAPLLLAAFALHWPELDRQARVDAKTGLPNAKHWEDRSRDLISAAAMQHVPASVLILDIDHFKQVNDGYGHLVGDEVLENLASVLRSQINPGDVVGRFGGEEFVITMFALSPEESAAAAERIRRAVADQQHHVGHRSIGERGPTLDDASAGSAISDTSDWFRVTCTIGLATSAARGYELTALLSAADEALAAGKATGRNRVEAAAALDHSDHVSSWTVATDKRGWVAVARQQRHTRAHKD